MPDSIHNDKVSTAPAQQPAVGKPQPSVGEVGGHSIQKKSMAAGLKEKFSAGLSSVKGQWQRLVNHDNVRSFRFKGARSLQKSGVPMKTSGLTAKETRDASPQRVEEHHVAVGKESRTSRALAAAHTKSGGKMLAKSLVTAGVGAGLGAALGAIIKACLAKNQHASHATEGQVYSEGVGVLHEEPMPPLDGHTEDFKGIGAPHEESLSQLFSAASGGDAKTHTEMVHQFKQEYNQQPPEQRQAWLNGFYNNASQEYSHLMQDSHNQLILDREDGTSVGHLNAALAPQMMQGAMGAAHAEAAHVPVVQTHNTTTITQAPSENDATEVNTTGLLAGLGGAAGLAGGINRAMKQRKKRTDYEALIHADSTLSKKESLTEGEQKVKTDIDQKLAHAQAYPEERTHLQSARERVSLTNEHAENKQERMEKEKALTKELEATAATDMRMPMEPHVQAHPGLRETPPA